MGRLLILLAVIGLVLLTVVVLHAIDTRSKRRKQRIKQLQAELTAATGALDGVMAELQVSASAGTYLDSVIVQSHVDGYHARVRELYRKELRQ